MIKHDHTLLEYFGGPHPQTVQKFMWSLLLVDVIMKYLLHCSRNFRRAYVDHGTERRLRNKQMKVRKLMIILDFQNHTQDFQDHKVWLIPI